MIPFATYIIAKIEKAPGVTIYRLQKLNKTVPPVDEGTNVVDNFPGGKREVCVLIQGGQCTLMKKGYDFTNGSVIFTPVPYNNMMMVTDNIENRTKKYNNEKDILQAITPYIVTALCLLTIVGLGYINSSAQTKITEMTTDAQKMAADNNLKMTEKWQSLYNSTMINSNKPQTVRNTVVPIESMN